MITQVLLHTASLKTLFQTLHLLKKKCVAIPDLEFTSKSELLNMSTNLQECVCVLPHLDWKTEDRHAIFKACFNKETHFTPIASQQPSRLL